MNFDKRSLHVVAIAIVASVLIGVYGSYRCANPDYRDILMTKFNIWDFDGWSVAHITLFALIGFFYPEQLVVAMLLGASWEAFEHWCGESRPGFLGGFGNCVTTDPNIINSDKPWWYGRPSDLIMNAFGFMLGALVTADPDILMGMYF